MAILRYLVRLLLGAAPPPDLRSARPESLHEIVGTLAPRQARNRAPGPDCRVVLLRPDIVCINIHNK